MSIHKKNIKLLEQFEKQLKEGADVKLKKGEKNNRNIQDNKPNG